MYPEKTVPFDRSLQGLEKLDWETEWLPATKVKLRTSPTFAVILSNQHSISVRSTRIQMREGQRDTHVLGV